MGDGVRFVSLRSLPARERRNVLMPLAFGGYSTPLMRADLIDVVDADAPDVVVHELAEFAAAPIAAARGLPHVTVAYGTALSPTLLATMAFAVADVWVAEGIAPSDRAGLYDHLYLHPLPAGLGESPALGTVRPMRPMHFDGASREAPPESISSFGRERPGLYVTYGTEMSTLAP